MADHEEKFVVGRIIVLVLAVHKKFAQLFICRAIEVGLGRLPAALKLTVLLFDTLVAAPYSFLRFFSGRCCGAGARVF